MKKLVTIAMVLMMVFLTACSMESPFVKDGLGEDENVKIGLSISTLNNPFFVSLRDAIVADAEEKGYEIIVVNAQDDAATEISGIEDLIQQNVDVLLINPTDSAAVSSAVQSANNAGIPVITIDRSADNGEVETLITSDNVAGGEMAADFILEQLGEGAKVAEIQGIAGASATRERGEGFHHIADKQLDIVASQPADFDRTKGLTVMENTLQGKGDIQAVFAHNDEMALGAIEAIKAAGKDIVVIGFDGVEDALASVQAGELTATIAQQPNLMGQEAVSTVEKVLNGEELEEVIKVPLELKTK
ncbi:ribose ABC transporter substrate-binding protein RbsB [Oceanobacillus caeni]|uniref:ribose ABC transporter substrate-binding protein RbsB n=1 Tax=Bacillaceae TaxID=186817 RepID=UPI000621E3D7|nr:MULTISPECIES: ribose ABC transporter substrate-binding protein RbsB [Bacillaceae]KKE78512.1 D-ribose transporter subunit RbsB [Bacilli bacterium VT-13-104]PZD85437.1 ribose ABC transporter substrate-binding protein RbsB [Bacilli bacterium]MBU8791093.1 ribose ABC transporter substrate-binding protein RbsB [Oceanobacillus caeni]MCR1834823.1 ribose ABC transporter substrate-binding protein RbsB [Oceanobacillus caeni]MED4474500.1 ribose ABC transporter substrate-binding protein RbsB [Oceanobaci